MTVALNGIDLALETLNSVFYYRHIPNIIAVILQMVLIAEVLSLFFFLNFIYCCCIFPLLLPAPAPVREFYSCKSLMFISLKSRVILSNVKSQLPECSDLH